MTRLARLAACFCAVCAVIVLAACGSSSKSSSSSSPSASASNPSLQDANARLDKFFAGTYTAPPSSSPRPAKNKKVWIVSLAQSYDASNIAATAAKKAATTLGWNATICDGKGDPNAILNCVRSAVAAKADGIHILFVDCADIKSGLQQARKAGIVVTNAESRDCNQTNPGTPALYNYIVTYQDGDGSIQDESKTAAIAGADWAIAATHGHAKAIVPIETDTYTTSLGYKLWRKEFETCAGCKVVGTFNFTAADLGPNLQQKMQQALLQHPDANMIGGTQSDSWITAGIGQAVRSSGKLGKILVQGGEGEPPNMQLIRKGDGEESMVTGFSLGWEAYAAMDAMNRIFNHQKPVLRTGIGVQIVDHDHNLPPAGQGFVPMKNGTPIPYEADYAKAWLGA